MDMHVTLSEGTPGLRLKNPILTASGTFGYGLEFAPYGDLRTLGGIVVKGLSLKPVREVKGAVAALVLVNLDAGRMI